MPCDISSLNYERIDYFLYIGQLSVHVRLREASSSLNTIAFLDTHKQSINKVLEL